MKYLPLLFSISFSQPLYAQVQLNAVIRDANSKEILPYVNIGIRNKDLGTVSNENGRFSISIPRQYIGDTLTFSMVGHHELSIPVAAIPAGQEAFFLRPKQVDLHEITIAAKKISEKKYGLSGKPILHFVDASMNHNDIFEIAQLIRLGKEISKITSINLLINDSRQDSGTFRINFYSYDGRHPGARLIEKSIVQKHAIREGWLRFDLSQQAIYLKGDIIASIEFIPGFRQSAPIAYEIKPAGRAKSFVRRSSMGIWQSPPHNYRMFVTALGTGKSVQEEETEKEMTPTYRIFSKAINDSFSIFIKLPRNYSGNNNKNYAVTYLLDANMYFNYVADSLEKMRDQQSILVGIGYKSFMEMDSLRDRDYTYPAALAADSFSVSGGGSRFYSFIGKELIPYIDKLYHTDKDNRTLMGHSLGGYFILYALYRDLTDAAPVFKHFVSASPSLGYYDEYLAKQFRELKGSTDTTPKTVYITWGGMEEDDDTDSKRRYSTIIREFVDEMPGWNLGNIEVKKQFYPYAAHMETAVPTFYYGLIR